ncbi:hypothetical protein GDO81_021155 [Engystomops pustulosus]|uniref:Uncharacterized protein n=1 Tax=Engystomops pustulosus TaxID=76066 RepID=A0AAV6YPS7_ENGPU|nr:hypothetical protein GDO81_021155 [Engystomops pustulosus]
MGEASGHPGKRSMHTGTYSYVPLFGSWIKSICSLWKGYSSLDVTFCGVFTTLPGLWRAQTIKAFTSLMTGVVTPGANHWWFMCTSMAILDVSVCVCGLLDLLSGAELWAGTPSLPASRSHRHLGSSFPPHFLHF